MPDLCFVLDGERVTADVPIHFSLARALREVLGATGTKVACAEGGCGACAVLVNGTLVHSCVYPAHRAASRDVVTVAGLSDGAVARALTANGAPQCGFCIPGFVVAATALVESGPVSEAEVREALAGNLCRCTGYAAIVDAVLAAAGESSS